MKYIKTPRDHESAFWLYGDPNNTSGALYPISPTIPITVCVGPRSCAFLTPEILAMPLSEFYVIIMFDA